MCLLKTGTIKKTRIIKWNHYVQHGNKLLNCYKRGLLRNLFILFLLCMFITFYFIFFYFFQIQRGGSNRLRPHINPLPPLCIRQCLCRENWGGVGVKYLSYILWTKWKIQIENRRRGRGVRDNCFMDTRTKKI